MIQEGTVFFDLKGSEVSVFHWNPRFFKPWPEGCSVSGDDAFFLFFRGNLQKNFHMETVFKVRMMAVGAFHDNDIVVSNSSSIGKLPLGAAEWAERNTVLVCYMV